MFFGGSTRDVLHRVALLICHHVVGSSARVEQQKHGAFVHVTQGLVESDVVNLVNSSADAVPPDELELGEVLLVPGELVGEVLLVERRFACLSGS